MKNKTLDILESSNLENVAATACDTTLPVRLHAEAIESLINRGLIRRLAAGDYASAFALTEEGQTAYMEIFGGGRQ